MPKRYTPKARKFRPCPVPRATKDERRLMEAACASRPVVGCKRWLGYAAWGVLFLLWLGLAAGFFIQRFF